MDSLDAEMGCRPQLTADMRLLQRCNSSLDGDCRLFFRPLDLKAVRNGQHHDADQMSRCTKLGDLENNEWIVALKWETQHRNCI